MAWFALRLPRHEYHLNYFIRFCYINLTMKRLNIAALSIAYLTLTPALVLGQSGTGLKLPSTNRFFIQPGFADTAKSLTVGITWPWDQPSQWGVEGLVGYWEASIGYWNPKSDPAGLFTRNSTQLGITPVLRYYPYAQNQFFLEGAIGFNLITPVYRNGGKQFSTSYQFGDHIGLGLVFGSRAEHEITLRYQHFSNAGLKKPNPGEDFLQIRYSLHY